MPWQAPQRTEADLKILFRRGPLGVSHARRIRAGYVGPWERPRVSC